MSTKNLGTFFIVLYFLLTLPGSLLLILPDMVLLGGLLLILGQVVGTLFISLWIKTTKKIPFYCIVFSWMLPLGFFLVFLIDSLLKDKSEDKVNAQ